MATGHKYGEPKWTWSEDGKMQRQRLFVIMTTVIFKEIVANVTGQVKKKKLIAQKMEQQLT